MNLAWLRFRSYDRFLKGFKAGGKRGRLTVSFEAGLVTPMPTFWDFTAVGPKLKARAPATNMIE
jgi:hypothetical protein